MSVETSQENTYQWLLRALGAYLDEEPSCRISLAEVSDGFLVRLQRALHKLDPQVEHFKRDTLQEQLARLRGERAPYVMFVEILPNVMPPIIVETTVRLGYAIFTVAGLTFLGFGVQPPSPDWSLQISDNYTLLNSGTYWWTVLFPALAIASLVIAVNLIADGIARVLER